jgi:DNA-binding MarR family transcriptional regulator
MINRSPYQCQMNVHVLTLGGMTEEAEPRWLDEEEQAAWMSLGGLLVQLPAELDTRMQRLGDLTNFEYVVLAQLSEAPDRTLRVSELAGVTRGSLSRLSHLLKRLEARGWVRREPAPEDGRYTNAILTGPGWDKVVATAPLHVEIIRNLVIDVLTRSQRRQLREISRRILRGLTPESSC